jgi:hypothetical protein
MIKRHGGRPDADWNWPYQIAPLVLFGMSHRRGRIFQLTVGSEQRPAAMIALLSRERWCLDAQNSASFLFFLSTAPPECLIVTNDSGHDVSPKMIGQAALDLAVCIALNECDGRLWLHADPKGSYNLLTWYQHRGTEIVDPITHQTLPGFATGRANDGRYLYFNQNTALRFYNAHAHLR